MATTPPTPRRKRALPPPTRSEAAFERAFAQLRTHAQHNDVAVRAAPDGFIERLFARRVEYLDDPYASIGDASTFHTKVVGVSFEGRQDVVAGLRVGYDVDLVRQPENPKDANAIAVRFGALPIGFLRAGIAKHLAPQIDAGARYRARIESLTGGDADGRRKHRGVNLLVTRDAVATIAERAHTREASRGAWDGDAERVRRALIGDARPHDAQRAVLDRLDAGRNTLAVFGTGRGKSFCFQFPAALRALTGGGKTLVIYPLRSLANDQFDALTRKFDPLGLRIYRANGSISHDEREELFEALREGAWDFILATPEFLAFHRAAFTGSSSPSFVVVDEAHHLYESTHRPAYAGLGETIASLVGAQVLALTATAGDAAFAKIARELRIDAWVIDPTIRANLRVVDARETKDKLAYLRGLFEDDEKGIVYCNSRKEATDVALGLRKTFSDEVAFYHAGMPSADRGEVERYFREGRLRIVVATSAFGEGIDLPDVRHVVLYHLNFDFTEFNQQAGRAGRDGDPASIHLLFGDTDRRINEYIIDRDAPTLPVLRALYRGIKGLSFTGVVRMNFVEIARTLELDKVNDRTVSRAVRIFEDEGLLEVLEDDDGRAIRFLLVDGKVDLEKNERFAEGEAERESFRRFCELVLTAKAETLERIINRPIYPERTALTR